MQNATLLEDLIWSINIFVDSASSSSGQYPLTRVLYSRISCSDVEVKAMCHSWTEVITHPMSYAMFMQE